MFADIPGQARAKAYFAGALARGPGHAYLLAGPEGLGKRRFALELGTALVAPCGGCGHCADCERLARGVNPDLTVVEREGEFIRIEQIAALIADLSLKPFFATRRVWVVIEPERLNVEAANTFLKSLEEPPSHVHFILVSDEPERVLPTIISRCQVIEFQPDADERERVWHARRLDALQRREQARVSRLAALDALDHLSSFVRDVWAVGLGAAGAVSNRDRLAELQHAAVARPDLYARLLVVVGHTRKDLSLNIDRRLALQAMFARFQEVWESA